jgi:hypothetical protein
MTQPNTSNGQGQEMQFHQNKRPSSQTNAPQGFVGEIPQVDDLVDEIDELLGQSSALIQHEPRHGCGCWGSY